LRGTAEYERNEFLFLTLSVFFIKIKKDKNENSTRKKRDAFFQKLNKLIEKIVIMIDYLAIYTFIHLHK